MKLYSAVLKNVHKLVYVQLKIENSLYNTKY